MTTGKIMIQCPEQIVSNQEAVRKLTALIDSQAGLDLMRLISSYCLPDMLERFPPASEG